MTSPAWQLRQRDVEFFERELSSFVPDRLYDAHAHLGRRCDWAALHQENCANTPEVMDIGTYRAQMAWLAPGRTVEGVVAIPVAVGGEAVEEGNRFVAELAAAEPGCAHAMVVSPATPAEELWTAIKRSRPRALKCYHLMSPCRPTFDSILEDYLPEHMARVAAEAGVPIILHLVRSTALSDAGNQEGIRALCTRHPRLRLVLAHGARGFNPSHTIRGIDAIKGLDNIYFDTSCVAEGGTLEAILKTFGHSRLMWGSDYPFSHLHGRCIAVDNGFAWLFDSNIQIGEYSPDSSLEFVLVGLEACRVLKHACLTCGLSDRQVEAILCDNARAFFA